MNTELINMLIKRAGLVSVNIGCDESMLVFDKQEFASLIIRECARVQSASSSARHGYDKYEDGNNILLHFGVK